MRHLLALFGLILVFFGSLLLNIHENGQFHTNLSLKMLGVLYFIIGLNIMFPRWHFRKKKKDQDSE